MPTHSKAIREYQIQHAVSEAIGKRVTIGGIEARWLGLHPEIELSNVQIHDHEGRVALSLPAVRETGLREQHFGRVEGMRVDDIQRDLPEAWAGWLRFDEDFAMPEGESTRAFHARVMEAVQRVCAAHPEQTVVVVTHGGVLDMIYRTARSLGLSGPRVSEIPNAGFNRIRVREGGIDILDWADTRHLADLPPQPVYDQQKLAATEGSPRAA